MHVAELFCGIGGCAACLPAECSSLGIDINQQALKVYRRNYSHSTLCKSIESISAAEAKSWRAGLWWMSPPCQPYTRRGRKRDLHDTRAQGLLHVIELIGLVRPHQIAIENVPEFQNSQSCQRLVQKLTDSGYVYQEILLCPTRLGAINRRARYFLIASRSKLRPWRTPIEVDRPQLQIQEPADTACLRLPDRWLAQYQDAMHIIEAENGRIKSNGCRIHTTCFTSAYGRSPVRSGSYLRQDNRLRFFSPREILHQLGFDSTFQLPDWPNSRLWPLIGNSLSLPCVDFVLQHLFSDAA